MRRWLPLIAFLPALMSAPLFGSGLKAPSRVAILRSLDAEYAAVKVALPRGSKGVFVKSTGEVDQDGLKHELVQYGPAVKPPAMVQITAITFHDKEIVFEINGGRGRMKWYDHIQAGMGPDITQPVTDPNATATTVGSYITLAFPNSLTDMTVDQVKSYLSAVLDFNPPKVLPMIPHPVPPPIQEAIKAKKAVVGMDSDEVLAALGPPPRKVRETTDGTEQEDWIYGQPPMKVTFVTFENDKVVSVKDYEGGVRGETVPPPEDEPR